MIRVCFECGKAKKINTKAGLIPPNKDLQCDHKKYSYSNKHQPDIPDDIEFVGDEE